MTRTTDAGPYYVKAVQTAQATAEAIEPLAYERDPSVQECNQRGVSNRKPEEVIRNLHLSVFFDGTGNNMLRDQRSPTNVVELFKLHRVDYDAETQTQYAALYVRGVGTLDTEVLNEETAKAFKAAEQEHARRLAAIKESGSNGWWAERGRDMRSAAETARYRSEQARIKARNYDARRIDTMGSAGGKGAADRIRTAYDWVRSQVKSLDPKGAITLNAFGFSRGAATARSFWNAYRVWLSPELMAWPDRRFRFLGLFDSVASFGVGGGRRATPGHNCHLSDALGTTFYHAVAEDEFRANFRFNPAEITSDVPYTGAHSDVGGGYKPNDQFRRNHLARIPLVRMFDAASTAGVGLNVIAEHVRAQAREMDLEAARFRAVRPQVWRIAYDLNKDKKYCDISKAEFEKWCAENVGILLREVGADDSLSGILKAAMISNRKLLDHKANIASGVEFWNTYIHLPYYFRYSGSSTEKGAQDTGAMEFVGMATHDLDEDFVRESAKVYDYPPLSGYPNFEWDDTH